MFALVCLRLLFASVPVTALQKFASGSSVLQTLRSYTFDQFVRDFNRTYHLDTAEWTKREQIFNTKRQEAIEFQAGPPKSWIMGVTKFMDYSEPEFKAMLGYRGSGSRRDFSHSGNLVQESRHGHLHLEAPDAYEVKKGPLNSLVRDQGSCGSCWAVAATAVLEGHMEQDEALMKNINLAAAAVQANPSSILDEIGYDRGTSAKPASLSSQTVVSCTKNPRNCGGTGGCQGATAELAYDLVKSNGLPLASTFPYTSGSGEDAKCEDGETTSAVLGIKSYVVVKSNKFLPLLEALSHGGGPVAVSVDATSWDSYAGGIFSDSSGTLDLTSGTGRVQQAGQFNVNHAVALVGYKKPANGQQGYYKIKNSWGSYWGEEGYIRLEMKPDEEKHCGIDTKTHDGVACDGDPDTAKVCGTCGILYDNVYPAGLYFKK